MRNRRWNFANGSLCLPRSLIIKIVIYCIGPNRPAASCVTSINSPLSDYCARSASKQTLFWALIDTIFLFSLSLFFHFLFFFYCYTLCFLPLDCMSLIFLRKIPKNWSVERSIQLVPPSFSYRIIILLQIIHFFFDL